MKHTLALLMSGLFGASVAQATIVNVSTLGPVDGVLDLPIVDNAGTPLPSGSGSIAIGSFAAVPSFNTATTYAELSAGFRQFGEQSSAISNSFGAAGFIESLRFQVDTASNADIIGSSVVAIIGNAATLESSTLFAVLTGAATFTADSGPNEGQSGAVFLNDSTNALFGSLQATPTTITFPGEGDFDFSNAIVLQALNVVPEPSAVLLGGLALLGGVIRRRR